MPLFSHETMKSNWAKRFATITSNWWASLLLLSALRSSLKLRMRRLSWFILRCSLQSLNRWRRRRNKVWTRETKHSNWNQFSLRFGTGNLASFISDGRSAHSFFFLSLFSSTFSKLRRAATWLDGSQSFCFRQFRNSELFRWAIHFAILALAL